jgi:hydroxymethylglutaryl-CoA synthase
VVGYGSGAGSDAFDIEVTDEITKYDREFGTPVQEYLDHGHELPYSVYAKFRGKIHMGGS